MDIKFKQHTESFMKIECADYGIYQELSEFFSFFVDGWQFSPKAKLGVWDGKIRLFDTRNKNLPKGLLKVAIKFCKTRDYQFEIDPALNPKSNIDEYELLDWIDNLKLTVKGEEITLRDYQVDAILQSLRYYRNLLLSPTSSGKSAVLYAKVRYHVDILDHNVVLIVPTTQLVLQLYSDFKDYSSTDDWDVDEHVQLLYSGKEKLFANRILISTWQSLTAMSKFQPELFSHIVEKTDCICMDEAHVYKSTVVLETMNKFVNTRWRTGTTGTLDDSKINKLQLIGLMSEPYQVITTKELMDQNSVVKLDINVVKINYPDVIKKELTGMDYKEEINYLVTLDSRNKFISDLAVNCKGVTLVLFTYIEKHGNILYEMIQQLAPNKTVKFLHGAVDVEAREEARAIANTNSDVIIIASSAIFSTGVNIPAIENIIFAMPTKSTIRIRQSIGRGLRLRDGKSKCTLFDIADDLSFKSYINTTLRHLFHRIEIYKKEQFNFKVNELMITKFMTDYD